LKLLITGGNGYLGRRMVDYLRQVPGIDVSIGIRGRSVDYDRSYNEIVYFGAYSRSELERACEGVDVIIHLAGLNAATCQSASREELEFDVDFVNNLLLSARCAGVERFVYFSSAHVYGNIQGGIIEESTVPAPVHPYSVNHFNKENLVRKAHEAGEIKGIVVRLSNAFGVPASLNSNCWNLAVNDFCCQVAVHSRLALLTSGLQERDFVSIFEVCKAVEFLICVSPHLLGDGVFNLGGEWSVSIFDMAKIVQSRFHAVAGKMIQLERQSSASEEFPSAVYGIEKIKGIGYEVDDSKRVDEIDNTIKLCVDNREVFL